MKVVISIILIAQIAVLLILFSHKIDLVFNLSVPYNMGGIISGIFSTLAFGVAFYALYTQRRQFIQQREDDKKASEERRKEYKEQIKIEQVKLDEVQRYYSLHISKTEESLEDL